MSMLGSGPTARNIGMGNLADELADAFSDSDEDHEEAASYGDEGQGEVSGSQSFGPDDSRDNIVDTNSRTGCEFVPPNNGSLNIPSPMRHGHQRKGSEYDGSEYGSESDFEAAGLTASLITKIDGVESLVRRGMEKYGGPEDDVFKRVTEGLRDLGSQSSVEGSASR